MHRSFSWPVAILAFLLTALLGLSWGPGGLDPFPGQEIFFIRLARVLLASLVGSGLAASGAALQSILGNPLAEPYLLGVSGGAACGTAMALVMGLSSGLLGAFSLQAFSFAFGAGAIFLVYRLARVHGRRPAETMILSGVVVNAFFSGLIMLMMSLAGRQLNEMIYILMGSLGIMFTRENTVLLAIAGGLNLGGIVYLWSRSRSLNLMILGEAQARSLGVEVESFKRSVFFLTALMVAALVSLAGVIGFVGLIVPHLGRLLSGPDNRRLMPISALLGGGLLILSDTIARSLGGAEIPVGVVTALIGVPFFIFLLGKRKASSS